MAPTNQGQKNVHNFKELDAQVQNLLREALEVRLKAYCPYSNFQVGAAILTDNNTLYTGCNIENASFTVGICAERTAYAKAISCGHKKFKTVAVVANNHQEIGFTTPCGACRQFMSEFGDVDVYLAKPELDLVYVTSLSELLPMSFFSKPDHTF